MKPNRSILARYWVVAAFAIAMAWVESTVVFYLRTMIDRIEPYQTNPLPAFGGLGHAELVREAATLAMLLAVGVLAGRSWRARFGYVAIAFGIWDIFYYVFLKVLTGWPHSLTDWDILFLLPLPWWGPVLAPVLISILMIFWGTLASLSEQGVRTSDSNWKPWGVSFVGIMLALYVFMEDAIGVANQGVDAVRNVLPSRFNWPLFCLAFGLMAAPIARMLQATFNRQRRSLTNERLATM